MKLATASDGFGRLVSSNSLGIYELAADYLAYRIAWHMYQFEKAEKLSHQTRGVGIHVINAESIREE